MADAGRMQGVTSGAFMESHDGFLPAREGSSVEELTRLFSHLHSPRTCKKMA